MSTRQYEAGFLPPAPGMTGPDATPHRPERTSLWTVRRPDGSIAPGWYLAPLRLFLGVTFVFAALQKLANPDFFRTTSPISIHSQILAATHTSPIHSLVSPLLSLSTAVGLVIAVGELAVGVGTLLGLFSRVAAVGGLLLNLMLFLTVSFHAAPFYTGSDVVFVFAWTPFILAGAAGAPAIDTWLARQRVLAAARPSTPVAPAMPGVSRRSVVSVGAVTAAAAGLVAILGGAAAGLGRAIGGTSGSDGGTPLLSTAPPPTSKGATTTTTKPSGSTGTPKGTAVGSSASVPVGGSAAFTDPKSGDPSIVIQQTANDFVAFDAICPHEGCTVAYQASSRIIACPCHGSEFNPKNGDVVRGPAPHGLTPIGITKGPNGDLYVRT